MDRRTSSWIALATICLAATLPLAAVAPTSGALGFQPIIDPWGPPAPSFQPIIDPWGGARS